MPEWCNQKRRGLEIQTVPTYEQWEYTGGNLSLVADSLPFLIGDWIVVGMDTFGEDWSQATKYFKDKREGTLKNYASLCRKIPYELRREELTYSHHQHARTLSKKDLSTELDYAIENELNSEEFKEYINTKYKKDKIKNGILEDILKIKNAAENLRMIIPDWGIETVKQIYQLAENLEEDYKETNEMAAEKAYV